MPSALAAWLRHNGQSEVSKLWPALDAHTWSPSQDQCGILRPIGTSSADRW
jgi:hypothetical protein